MVKRSGIKVDVTPVEEPKLGITKFKTGGEGKDLITLSSGIVLRLKSVPPETVRRAGEKIPKPKPPVVFIESKGREEENPFDPDYAKALEEWIEQCGNSRMDSILVLGVEIHHLPEGVDGPDDSNWLEELEYLGIANPLATENKLARKLDWLKCYALRTGDDIIKVANQLYRKVGAVTEEEVLLAMESFPGGNRGRTDNGSPPEAHSEDEHKLREDSTLGSS